jgi:hypothetical protein
MGWPGVPQRRDGGKSSLGSSGHRRASTRTEITLQFPTCIGNYTIVTES